jgi:hypothetical protein
LRASLEIIAAQERRFLRIVPGNCACTVTPFFAFIPRICACTMNTYFLACVENLRAEGRNILRASKEIVRAKFLPFCVQPWKLCLQRDAIFCVFPWKIWVYRKAVFACVSRNCACTWRDHFACFLGNCGRTGKPFLCASLEIVRAQ